MLRFFHRYPWTYHGKDCILRYACQCGCSSVDRVLASEAKGRWFDSSQPHQIISIKSTACVIFVAQSARACNERPCSCRAGVGSAKQYRSTCVRLGCSYPVSRSTSQLLLAPRQRPTLLPNCHRIKWRQGWRSQSRCRVEACDSTDPFGHNWHQRHQRHQRRSWRS